MLHAKNVFVTYADSTGQDQTALLSSLTKAFADHLQNNLIIWNVSTVGINSGGSVRFGLSSSFSVSSLL